MRRDWDICREILRQVAASDARIGHRVKVDIPDKPKELVLYNVQLLKEAGFIHTIDIRTIGSTDFWVTGLTWEGNEFLDSIANESVWAKTKGVITNLGGSATVAMVKAAATEAGRALFKRAMDGA